MSIENVLGLDLETTGLDPELDGILEIGMALITPNYEVLARYQVAIAQPQEILSRMDPTIRAQHARSGLLEECADRGHPFVEVAKWVSQQVNIWFPEGKAILLGNSIHFDRQFIKKQMPTLEKLLHYRMIDVLSIREAVRIFGSPHRSLQDVEASVDQLRQFMRRIS